MVAAGLLASGGYNSFGADDDYAPKELKSSSFNLNLIMGTRIVDDGHDSSDRNLHGLRDVDFCGFDDLTEKGEN